MPSDPAHDAPAQRLHPSSILFGLGSTARNLVGPAVLFLVASRSGSSTIWLTMAIIPVGLVTIGMLIRYFTYRYRMGPVEMVIREGIFTRNERHIPYARIQNIDLIQNPLHRLLEVAVVRIETASGGKPEAEIKVLKVAAVDEMRSRVFRDREAATSLIEPGAESSDDDASDTATGSSTPDSRSSTARPSPLLSLPVRELVILGIISNRGMLVVAAVIGLLSQTGIFDFDPDDWSQADLERYGWIPGAIQSALENGNVFLMALLVIVGIVVLVILMRFLSIAWAVAKFYGFTLTQRGDDLRAEYGLLTKVSATLPSHRIQLLSTRMSRLHRWFHRRSVQVQTAGGSAGGEQADATRTQWLAPVMPSADVPGLVREVWPEVDLDAVSWTPIEPRSWKRLFRRGLLWVLPLSVVGLLALFPWRPWGLLIGIPALAMAYIHARRWVAATGYALIPGAILFKSGWWGTSTSIVRFSKIQALSLNQTPFDRRHAMATLSVDTAGAGGGTHRIDIPFLDSEIASGIVDTLYEEASRTAFRW